MFLTGCVFACGQSEGTSDPASLLPPVERSDQAIDVTWSFPESATIQATLRNNRSAPGSLDVNAAILSPAGFKRVSRLVTKNVESGAVTSIAIDTRELPALAAMNLSNAAYVLKLELRMTYSDGAVEQLMVPSLTVDGDVIRATQEGDGKVVTLEPSEAFRDAENWKALLTPEVARASEESMRLLPAQFDALHVGTEFAEPSAMRPLSGNPTHSFCFQGITTYTDHVGMQDTAKEMTLNRPLPQTLVVWQTPTGSSYFGFTDINGCIAFSQASAGAYQFQVYSYAVMGNSTVDVRYDPSTVGTWSNQIVPVTATYTIGSSPEPQVLAFASDQRTTAPKCCASANSGCEATTGCTSTQVTCTLASGAQGICDYLSPGPMNLIPAMQWAVFKNYNANTWTYSIRLKEFTSGYTGDDNGEGTSCYLSQSQSIYRGPLRHAGHMMQQSHELGHGYFCASTGDGNIPGDYGYPAAGENANTCPTYGNGHGIDGIEYQGAAVVEAFANFFNADTWNNDQNDDVSPPDCWIDKVAGQATQLDCAGGTNVLLDRVKTSCSPFRATAGGDVLGNEWDWTRAFWKMKSDPAHPTMQNMMDWFHLSRPGMTKGNVYFKLDGAANSNASVAPAVKTAWNNVKVSQGIDVDCKTNADCATGKTCNSAKHCTP